MEIQIGDFINVTAWGVTGQVVDAESAWFGSDNAQRVLVQECPGRDGRWYHLEPGQFSFV